MILEQVYHQPPEGGDADEMLLISDCEAEIPYVTAAEDGNAVFSVWCAAESGGTITVRIGAHTENINVSGEWSRITIALTEFERTDRIVIGEYGQNEVYLYKAQLETGNRATDWKPAPEDAEEEIDEARDSAEAAQNRADEAYDELNSRLLLDTDGMHVGKQDDAADRRNEILIRTGSNPTIDFIFDGVAEASIAKDYHRFGNMEIRVPSVGGFIFQAVGGGE